MILYSIYHTEGRSSIGKQMERVIKNSRKNRFFVYIADKIDRNSYKINNIIRGTDTATRDKWSKTGENSSGEGKRKAPAVIAGAAALRYLL
jgi:hypothetical protein